MSMSWTGRELVLAMLAPAERCLAVVLDDLELELEPSGPALEEPREGPAAQGREPSMKGDAQLAGQAASADVAAPPRALLASQLGPRRQSPRLRMRPRPTDSARRASATVPASGEVEPPSLDTHASAAPGPSQPRLPAAQAAVSEPALARARASAPVSPDRRPSPDVSGPRADTPTSSGAPSSAPGALGSSREREPVASGAERVGEPGPGASSSRSLPSVARAEPTRLRLRRGLRGTSSARRGGSAKVDAPASASPPAIGRSEVPGSRPASSTRQGVAAVRVAAVHPAAAELLEPSQSEAPTSPPSQTEAPEIRRSAPRIDLASATPDAAARAATPSPTSAPSSRDRPPSATIRVVPRASERRSSEAEAQLDPAGVAELYPTRARATSASLVALEPTPSLAKAAPRSPRSSGDQDRASVAVDERELERSLTALLAAAARRQGIEV